MPKKNTNSIPTPAHLKKRLRLHHICKTTLVPPATENMRLRLPTLTPQPVSRLSLGTPKSGLGLITPKFCLVSVSKHRVSTLHLC